MQLLHLAEAERRIALGMRIIADQEERIALRRSCHDVTLAQQLLDKFELTQNHHLAHPANILAELEACESESPSYGACLGALRGGGRGVEPLYCAVGAFRRPALSRHRLSDRLVDQDRSK